MSKQEFIDKLRLALNGRVSARLVEENVAYYEEYINGQIYQGKSEASVMRSLGDPRLIAKTIIAANNGEGAAGTADNTARASSYNDGSYYSEPRQTNYPKVVGLPGWVWILLVAIIVILIISALFSLVSALLPVAIPVLVVVFFIKLFRDWLK